MQSAQKMLLTTVAIVGLVALSAGISNSASSDASVEKGQPALGSSTGSGAGGGTEESNQGTDDTCTEPRRPGACVTVKRSLTVESAEVGGTMGTGSGGGVDSNSGGTIDKSSPGTTGTGAGDGVDKKTGGTDDGRPEGSGGSGGIEGHGVKGIGN